MPELFSPSRLSAVTGLLFIVAACGCMPSEQNAWVYIDNTTNSEMTVVIDSNEAAKVPAGSVEKIKLITGEHAFMVRSAGTILYNGIHTVTPSNSFMWMQSYIFNPDRKGRYATMEVHYGSAFKEKLKQIAFQNKDEEQAVRDEYRDLVKNLKALPSNAWVEVPQGAKVFEPAPESVRSKRSTTRLVLNRIDEKGYNFLNSALKKTTPTLDELADLWEFSAVTFFN